VSLGNPVRRAMAVAALMAMAASAAAALAEDDATTDAIDQDTLERALFLCQWKTAHDVPDKAPNPAVCRSSAVSTDDAMLQLKQWWTFWARLNPEAALRANQQFSTDYAAFHSRLTVKPELAAELMPPGIKLQQGDWRLRLIRELTRRYGKPAPPVS
jgi:ABC-type glycerol-3-phosphate transport system substrate-binding protein